MASWSTTSRAPAIAGPEPACEPMRCTRDERFHYAGYSNCPSVCRIQIYEAPDRVPVVICTELDDNHGTSVTNRAEIIAASVLLRYLPHRQGEEPPFVWIEHYEADDRTRRLRLSKDYDLVTFASYAVTFEWVGARRHATLGLPTWTAISRDELSKLLGQPNTGR